MKRRIGWFLLGGGFIFFVFCETAGGLLHSSFLESVGLAVPALIMLIGAGLICVNKGDK
jgi:hypothetical protein